MIIMLAAIALFIAAIGSLKFFQIKAAIAQGASWQPPPEAVTTIVASQDKWPATLGVIGTVAAVHGVTVSADLPGIVESISFDSGKRVEAGDVLVRLDTRQERAQLAAAESQRDLSKLNLDRSQQLLQRGVVAQAEFDRMAARASRPRRAWVRSRRRSTASKSARRSGARSGSGRSTWGNTSKGARRWYPSSPWIPCT